MQNLGDNYKKIVFPLTFTIPTLLAMAYPIQGGIIVLTITGLAKNGP